MWLPPLSFFFANQLLVFFGFWLELSFSWLVLSLAFVLWLYNIVYLYFFSSWFYSFYYWKRAFFQFLSGFVLPFGSILCIVAPSAVQKTSCIDGMAVSHSCTQIIREPGHKHCTSMCETNPELSLFFPGTSVYSAAWTHIGNVWWTTCGKCMQVHQPAHVCGEWWAETTCGCGEKKENMGRWRFYSSGQLIKKINQCVQGFFCFFFWNASWKLKFVKHECELAHLNPRKLSS